MDESEARGRPTIHTEPWAKIGIILLDRNVAFLDRLAIDIRLKHGKAISRAEIIRGVIEWMDTHDTAALEEFIAQFAGTLEESE